MPIQVPVENIRMWGAYEPPYTFAISYEEGDGYRASWKSEKADMTPFGKQPSNFIDGSPFKELAQAEAACRHTLKALQRPA